MSPDDEGGDEPRRGPEGVGGPPPQPADRPWVHPSELQSFVASPTSTATRARPREWAVGLGSALAASVVTVLVLLAFGALGNGSRAVSPQPDFVGTPSGVISYSDDSPRQGATLHQLQAWVLAVVRKVC